jgi:hypothetical protein
MEHRIVLGIVCTLLAVLAPCQAAEPETPAFKKVEITREIQSQIDRHQAPRPYHGDRLPKDARTLGSAYDYLKGRAIKEYLESGTIYGGEAVVGEGDGKRTLFVYAGTPDFRGNLVYALSNVRHVGGEWPVFVKFADQNDPWQGTWVNQDPEASKRLRGEVVAMTFSMKDGMLRVEMQLGPDLSADGNKRDSSIETHLSRCFCTAKGEGRPAQALIEAPRRGIGSTFILESSGKTLSVKEVREDFIRAKGSNPVVTIRVFELGRSVSPAPR